MDVEQEECECPPAGSPRWMTTFADLVTLLLCFFVLILSFANMDVVKFESVTGSLKDAFGYQEENSGNFHPAMIARRSKMLSEIERLLYGGPLKKREQMERKVRDLIQTKKLEKQMQTETNEKGLIIRVKEQAFFSGGGSKLSAAGFPILDDVAKLLAGFPCQILIEGHTDNSPINTNRFASNWELSTSRSIAVMRYLVEVGGLDPKRIGAAGYADMRPLKPNTTKANRLANRRVEFVCHRYLHPRSKMFQTPGRSSPTK